MGKRRTDKLRAAMAKGALLLKTTLVDPKSKSEDLKRREFIFNVISLTSVCISGIFASFVLYYAVVKGDQHKGIPFPIVASIFAAFVLLYLLSRKGRFLDASYVLVGIFYSATTYTVFHWGTNVTMGLLAYALIIVITGILISPRFAFIITCAAGITLLLITYSQLNSIIIPDLRWKQELVTMSSVFEFVIILGAISVVSWLSNREISKSLNRAQLSELALRNERNMLEMKVQQRTEEMRKTQAERLKEYYRFAEFGRMASGLFHELINPLTNLSLNTERLKELKSVGVRDIRETQKRLKEIFELTSRTENFISAIRRQIQNQDCQDYFSLCEEIHRALQIFAYRARKSKVAINIVCPVDIATYGNPIKFNHLVANLISNALDAYENVRSHPARREINIRLHQNNETVSLSVKDWGCGIPSGVIGKIFDPLFTTKGMNEGMGIGLSMCKDIVERDFKGAVSAISEEGKGSEFTVTFKIRKENENDTDNDTKTNIRRC